MPSTAAPLDEHGLRNLHRHHDAARKILDAVASRGNDVGETPVELFIDELALDRASVIDALRQLGDVGCGEFVVGRRGAPSRFRWTLSTAALADRLAALDGDESLAAPVAVERAVEEATGPLWPHRFQLRPDLVIELRLPRDLTAREAARLGKFIESLPFE